MRGLVLVLSVSAIAGSIGLFAWSQRSSALLSAPEIAAQQRQLQALTRQVDSLRTRLHENENKSAPAGAVTLPPQAALRTAPPQEAPVADQAPRPVHEAAAPQAVDLETEFAREPPSGAAKQAESQLAARLARVMPQGSQIEEIECRAALCRVESSHHGVQGYREFLKATARHADEVWQGSVRFEAVPVPESAEADVVLVAYVSR